MPDKQIYPRLTIALHWLLALCIFFLFASSWWMLALPLPSDELRFREFPFQLHKNIGLTLLPLLALMMYARLRHRPSPHVEPGGLLAKIATVDHVVLYLLITAVCVSGYLSSAHTRWDTVLWWTVELPRLAEPDETMNKFFSDVHLWTCWLLLGFVALHISGVVFHAFRNDGIVRRMFGW